MDEESHLLGNGRGKENNEQRKATSDGLRLVASFVGGAAIACLAFAVMSNQNFTSSATPYNVEARFGPKDDYSHTYTHTHTHEHLHPHQNNEGLTSKYDKFQLLGFQIYTGGAPVEVPGKLGQLNPECLGLNSYGQASELDPDDIARNVTNTLWQCYLGHSNPAHDVRHRLEIMTDAVEKAYEVARHSSDTLKVFIAPEFFWRGKDGAYKFYTNTSDPELIRRQKQFQREDGDDYDPDCHEVCHVLKGLGQLVANKKYENWLFLFGTVIVSENLPQQDEFDFVFYNFAPMVRQKRNVRIFAAIFRGNVAW